MQHQDIWRGLDALAARHGLSASGLARRAGLDPTAFNRSKRMGRDGRPRWPSTESVARALEAVGAGLGDLVALIEPAPAVSLPALPMAEAGDAFTADGAPRPGAWGAVRLPCPAAPGAFILVIDDERMSPVLVPGQKVLVEPGPGAQAGSRVVARLTSGRLIAGRLAAGDGAGLRLAAANPDWPAVALPPGAVDWIARIAWASQ